MNAPANGEKEHVLSLAPRAGRRDDVTPPFHPLLDADQYSCSRLLRLCRAVRATGVRGTGVRGEGGFNWPWEETVPSRFSRATPNISDEAQVLLTLVLTLSKKCISGENKALHKSMLSSLTHLSAGRSLPDEVTWAREKNPRGRHHSAGEQWEGPTGSLAPRESDFKTGNPVTESLGELRPIVPAQTWLHGRGTVYRPQNCSREQRSPWCAGKTTGLLTSSTAPY